MRNCIISLQTEFLDATVKFSSNARAFLDVIYNDVSTKFVVFVLITEELRNSQKDFQGH